jgi:hypothetical protein
METTENLWRRGRRVRRHNARVSRPGWHRTYFWRHYEAPTLGGIILRASNKERFARFNRQKTYFWRSVRFRALRHFERRYGPGPSILHRPYLPKKFGAMDRDKGYRQWWRDLTSSWSGP